MKKQIVGAGAAFLFTAAALTSASAMEMTADSMMMGTSGSMMMKSEASSDLWLGSRGAGVVSLQTSLEQGGFLVMPAGVAKGYFGQATKRALIKYQTQAGVRATGYFGPLTRAAWAKSMPQGVLVGGALMVPNLDIVDNAVNASNVTTVVAAVKAAGLVDTLKSKGPFTVFAPTNSAFAKLPAGTVDTLVKPENKATLTSILTYHVVSGRYTSKDLMDGMMLTTVEGKTIAISKVNGKVMINGSATVETADVISSNGVTHVIDTVLMPK